MTMNDEDFQQEMQGYFRIESQRHRDIMTQGSDILAKITALSTSFDEFKASFDKQIGDVTATVPAGHSAVLDTLIPPLDDLQAKITALKAEAPTKMGAIPVPGTSAAGAAPAA